MRALLKTVAGLGFVFAAPAHATTLITVSADTYLPGTTTTTTCDFFPASCSSNTQASIFHFFWFSTEDLDILTAGPVSYQPISSPYLNEYVTISFGGLDQWGNSILNAAVQVFTHPSGNACAGFGTSTTHCTDQTGTYADTVRLTQIIPAPLPEPGTWAMLLLGFGTIGIILRRKSKTRLSAATH